MEKCKENQKTCILNLDDDLIAEIFIRLPIRSVLRAGAVCKDFRRVAYAHRRPLEILLYSAKAPAAAKRHGGQDTYYVDALSVSAARPARRRLADLPASIPRAERLGRVYCILLASCDGLVLLGTGAAGQYLICNPSLRQWTELPRLRRRHDVELLPSDAFRPSGFYFHESSGEYRLLCHVTVDEDSRAACYYVLSTGADEPRRLDKVEATRVHHIAIRPSACDMMTPGPRPFSAGACTGCSIRRPVPPARWRCSTR
jgi:hypothetical protein